MGFRVTHFATYGQILTAPVEKASLDVGVNILFTVLQNTPMGSSQHYRNMIILIHY